MNSGRQCRALPHLKPKQEFSRLTNGCAWNAVSAFAQLTDVPSRTSGAAMCQLPTRWGPV